MRMRGITGHDKQRQHPPPQPYWFYSDCVRAPEPLHSNKNVWVLRKSGCCCCCLSAVVESYFSFFFFSPLLCFFFRSVIQLGINGRKSWYGCRSFSVTLSEKCLASCQSRLFLMLQPTGSKSVNLVHNTTRFLQIFRWERTQLSI